VPTLSTTADVTDSTSATLTDVTGLSFPVASGRMYRFRAVLPYTSAATTTGIAVAVDVPASPTFFAATAEGAISTTVGGSNEEADATVTDAEQMTFSAAPATTGGLVVVEGYLKPSATGELKIQFNTEVNGSAVVVKAGATLDYRDCGAV
jgi:pectate lyase